MKKNERSGKGNVVRKSKMTTQQDISDLIGDIKKSYAKTNLKDITTAELSHADIAKRAGYLLSRSHNLSNKDFSMNFDPLEAEFLRKMVSEETIQKRVVLRAEDYFKGIVFLDYFTTIITDNSKFTDELYDIAKELERINPLLDPDMETLVKYAGISYVTTLGKDYIMSKNRSAVPSQKYLQNNYIINEDHLKIRCIDPFYDALGKKIAGMISDPQIIQYSSGFKGLNDLRSAIFVDCLMPYIENNEMKKDVLSMMDTGNFYKAAFHAIGAFSREASAKSLREYMQTLADKNRNNVEP